MFLLLTATLGRFLMGLFSLVATDPLTGVSTSPTKVVRDKKGNVEFPNDPHINQQGDATGPRPQTQHSGFAQGGTSNPPVGDDGAPKWYAPGDGHHELGAEEETPEAMFARDEEVNPRGDGHGPRTRFEGDFGTVDEPVYVPADESKSDSKKDK